MIIRPEENALLLWDRNSAGTAWLSGPELRALLKWADGGAETAFIRRLSGAFPSIGMHRAEIRDAAHRAERQSAPPRSLCAPESLHIEVTARCALSCPQCYKGSSSQQELPISRLLELLAQAEDSQVFQIALGGGEPLLYPHLCEAVAEAGRRGMAVSVTTSGTGLSAQRLAKLRDSGLDHMQVSLNGSTEKINGLSRDGYFAALGAIELLAVQPADFRRISCGVNWVARRDNLEDFPKLVKLAKDCGAANVNLLRYKPSPAEDYPSVSLTGEDCRRLRQMVKDVSGISIKVDSAFSNLLCDLNGRCGFMSGCGAGRRFLAVDSAGRFRPCSHIHLEESDMPDDTSLTDYWHQSPQLMRFRETPDRVGDPCASCRFLSGCSGCRAISVSLHGGQDGFYRGDTECPWHTA